MSRQKFAIYINNNNENKCLPWKDLAIYGEFEGTTNCEDRYVMDPDHYDILICDGYLGGSTLDFASYKFMLTKFSFLHTTYN